MATPEPEPPDLTSPLLPDLNQILDRQISAGFPPELAFDLVLHELVVRAATATRASAAALALARGNEMVCRAATGLQAPDLGVPLNTHEGLSGACLRTRQPQLCVDAESDPLVDADAAGRLGIRSMLIVPVRDDGAILGVREVFSSEPAAFSREHQTLLEVIASDCARLHRGMLEARMRPPVTPQLIPLVPRPAQEEPLVLESPAAIEAVPAAPARLYEGWTLILGTLAIVAAVGLSFLAGSRIGWIRTPLHRTQVRVPAPVSASPEASGAAAGATAGEPGNAPAGAETPPPRPSSVNPADSTAGKPDELVVYDHGKVIFRMKPAAKNGDSVVVAAEKMRVKGLGVWLAPELAERRLRSRVEPIYPAEALAAHRAGDVVLEIVVGEDGSVVTMRVVSGDPLLTSAALDAVRHWQYEPYRPNQHPTPFQTDVTLRFSLPQ